MHTPKLSICIPTRNFGKYLRQTLQSIVEQDCVGIEVVIVDGGSTDDTPDVVAGYRKLLPALNYIRQEKAMGVDRDLDTAVSKAKGEYCWLMSADDALKPRALAAILQELTPGVDTYLCNRTICDINLNPVENIFWLKQGTGGRVYDFTNRAEIQSYFESAVSLGALFSYISTIVFRLECWKRVAPNEQVLGTNYAHVYKLFRLLFEGKGRHRYIRQPLVLTRGNNDSFLESGHVGVVKRYLIDIDGYHLLGTTLFPDKELRAAFLGVMRREHSWIMINRVAIRVPGDDVWRPIRVKLSDCGYTPLQLFVIDWIRRLDRLVPISRMVRAIRRSTKSRIPRKSMEPSGHVASIKSDGTTKSGGDPESH